MIGNSNIFMPKSLYVAALLAAVAMLWPVATPPANASTTLQGTYWDADNRTCGNINSCQLQFAAVPVGKTLLVRRVGCLFQLPSTAKISHARLQRLNVVSTVTGYEILGPVPLTSNDNSVKHYSFNAETLLVVLSGEKPAVFLSLRETAANIQMQCTLHGEITP